jgi:predicted enzyme related to lactoylglutathione lyase
MDMGEMGVYQMFGQSKQGRTLGGLFNKPSQMPGPPAWLAYIKVPDARKTADAIKKAGAKIVNGPMEVPGGDWIAQGIDQQGAMFAVHSVVAAPPAAATASAPATASRKAAARKKPAAKKKAAPTKAAPRRKAAKKSAGKAKSARKAVKKSAKKKSAVKGKKGRRR